MKHWYDDAIFYHIYPLGAVNERRDNDYKLSTGGLERLAEWIPHAGKLGCTAFVLGPVFESKTHGYDTTDYRKLDSRLGTNEQFGAFVRKSHEAGLRVVVDGVFNHTGRDFFAFRDLLENKGASPYRDWYRGVNFGGNSPMNDGFSYEAWRGHPELARLNPYCPAVCEYLYDTVRMWIRDFGIDGIRLDCADCLDFGFMKELRRACLAEKEDFWLMGEIIHGDYRRWAGGDMLHSVTNYECQKGLFSSHNDGNMHEIGYSLNRQFGPGGIYKDLMLYNFADNHDVNRLADTVKRGEYLPTVYLLLFTMPGLPSVYYGSEWGIRGVTDRVTDWALRPRIDLSTVRMEDPALMELISALARARAGSEALRRGDYAQLAVSSHQLAFRRTAGTDCAVVLVNCADAAADITVQAGGEGWRDALSGEAFASPGGRLTVRVPAFDGMLLRPAAAPQAKPVDAGTWPAMAPPQPTAPATAQPPVPAAPPAAAAAPPQPEHREEEIRVVRVADAPLEHVDRHPTFEHRRCKVVDTARCKVGIYELAPGKSAYPYHYHTTRQEVFYILSGRGLLRGASGERQVSAGDLIYFPASERGAHRLINNYHEPLRYIDFDALGDGDVAVMPDSRKVNFYQTGGRIYRLGDEAGYYDGE